MSQQLGCFSQISPDVCTQHEMAFQFSLNVFTEFSDEKLSLKGFEPVAFSVRDQEAIITPTRHK